jgi:predicted small secreted protein
MKKNRLAALLALALCMSTLALSACNTTEGFGQDVQNTGADISNSAAKNK